MQFDWRSDLRCDVIRCSAKGGRGILRIQIHAAHTHISQTNMTVHVQHDVVKLQIATRQRARGIPSHAKQESKL